MGARHAARRLALQALYALEMNERLTPADAIACVEDGDETETMDREYFISLTTATWKNRDELDGIIGRSSKRWKLNRMDRIDKCVLRLSAQELLHLPQVPAPVIINEGVDLAKEFGAPDSSAFINGILDKISRDCRKNEQVPVRDDEKD